LGDDDLLDLEERVAQHIELSDEARNAVDPDSDRRFFEERIEQALEDLYQADAIEPDDDGLSLHITDVGRRFTEPLVRDLPEVVSDAVDADGTSSSDEDKPSVGSWISTILDILPPSM
jgi:hypothetical protein